MSDRNQFVQHTSGYYRRIEVSAALYDQTAEKQLTTELFVGAKEQRRKRLENRAISAFKAAVSPRCKPRWTAEQQERIHGFIDVVEALEP